MASVGFVVHERRPEARALAVSTIAWLDAQGHHGRLLTADPVADAVVGGGAPDPSQTASDVDLAVSLGGDGTMLRTVNLVSGAGIPVLGVNFGTLGYLTVVEPEGIRPALQRFLAGEHLLESRMTLDVTVADDDGAAPLLERSVLNDVVLARPGGGHTVRLLLSLNGAPFLSYAADSVIVATPTGSTAYNLSARGPIVSPRARVQILTPVAPHSLFDRSVVLDAGEEVGVTPAADTVADLVIDGMPSGSVKPGQQVTCREGAHDAVFVTFEERPFEGVLKRKFNLAVD